MKPLRTALYLGLLAGLLAGSELAASAVEIFAGEGEVVFTDLLLPSGSSGGLELFAEPNPAGLRVRSLDMWKLKSAW